MVWLRRIPRLSSKIEWNTQQRRKRTAHRRTPGPAALEVRTDVAASEAVLCLADVQRASIAGRGQPEFLPHQGVAMHRVQPRRGKDRRAVLVERDPVVGQGLENTAVIA